MSEDTNALLHRILAELADLKVKNDQLEQKVEHLSGSAGASLPNSPHHNASYDGVMASPSLSAQLPASLASYVPPTVASASPTPVPASGVPQTGTSSPAPKSAGKSSTTTGLNAKKEEASRTGMYSQRVILTTYPGQVGIHPVPLIWGEADPAKRGPVIASRHPNSIKLRNAIGAYSGSYSIYRALAVAMGALDPNHRPDFTNTEPAVDVLFNPSWADPFKIVSMDPWGHLAPTQFREHFEQGLDVRPTIAITKAHLKMAELDESVKRGDLVMDGKLVVPSLALPGTTGNAPANAASVDPGVEVNVSKAAVEPVWYLPGVAERFGITEGTLRRALFEDTGGMYPELLTRHDLKVFLPPIGGLTVYIFGNPAFVSDPSKELTLRVHDECNGSDVFGSDICTCRPYLLYGISEGIKCAQRGGVGIVVYFRKEGRALGEVTKYLVYNVRKRGGDSASMYFRRTEAIAGVKDMRFQALMPDVLHWLGVKKIDNMISMSDMKHDAIVNSGIPILKRYDLPDSMIPEDSRVEIDAKIAAGYFSASKKLTEADLIHTVGRGWEDLEHVSLILFLCPRTSSVSRAAELTLRYISFRPCVFDGFSLTVN